VRRKTTQWKPTEFTRWVDGMLIAVSQSIAGNEWQWNTPANQGWKPTKRAAMSEATRIVRKRKGGK
jgi:hypothetical protein